MADMLLRRGFANSLVPGDYAVDSYANPVSIDPVMGTARANEVAASVWEDIWGMATGIDDTEKQNLTNEEKVQVKESTGAYDPYLMTIVLLIVGLMVFKRKG